MTLISKEIFLQKKRDRQKIYRENNKDKLALLYKIWAAKNKEKLAKKSREYRLKNLEEVRKRDNEYHKARYHRMKAEGKTRTEIRGKQ